MISRTSRFRWGAFVALTLAWAAPGRAMTDAEVFENYCAACHGVDGRAQTAQGRKMKAKDLRESQLTDAAIERQIREGSVVKKGISVMPAVGKDMSDAEIAAVIRAVKAFRPPPK
jgi:mono/diheme cytochrome c family protein